MRRSSAHEKNRVGLPSLGFMKPFGAFSSLVKCFFRLVQWFGTSGDYLCGVWKKRLDDIEHEKTLMI